MGRIDASRRQSRDIVALIEEREIGIDLLSFSDVKINFLLDFSGFDFTMMTTVSTTEVTWYDSTLLILFVLGTTL